MRSKLYLAGVFCLVTFFAFSQTVPFPTHTDNDNTVPFPEKMDDVFGNLDLSDVTTNLLFDRAWPFSKPEAFDGSLTADTVKSHKHWLKLYGTMATAATTQPAPIPSVNDWKAQRDAEEAAGKNPLVIIHADYHRIKRDSALIYSLLYSQNGELYDHPNQSTSPYEAQNLFAFSPYKTTIYDSLSMEFRTSPAFFKTNTGLTVSTVEFDFDNGQGWRTVGVNATPKVFWSGFGKKQLKLRITYTNNQVYYAYSTLNLVQSPHYNPTGAKNYNEWWSGYQHIDHPDPALSNYGINLQIEYACGNDKILKPFIYVEGFSPDEYFEAFNNETYKSFYEKFTAYQNSPIPGYPLLDELEANGYDIIYVDFEQGAGNILENAQTLKKAIKWVNDQKTANGSNEPNVVAGYSMGGLVARLAVRQMELDNTYGAPDVSYFITVDTPHLGANIPFAVAIAVDDLARELVSYDDNMSDYEETLANARSLLNSPAAKQMLFYAFDIEYVSPLHIPIMVPAQLRSDFLAELQIGLPQTTIENVAIAKGNGQGNSQGFTGVAPLISVDILSDFNCLDELVDTYDLVDGKTFANTIINLTLGAVIDMASFFGATAGVELNINALPGGDQSYEIYGRNIQGELLWGLIDFNIGSRSVQAHGIPFDSAPGGHYSINAVSGTGESGQFFQDILAGNYTPCIEIHETQFGFIPTVSALNIPGKLTTPFAPIDPLSVVANNETEFDRVFILDPTLYPPNTAPTNEAHVDLTPSNVGPFEEFISPAFNNINSIAAINGYTYNFGHANASQNFQSTNDRITRLINVGNLSTGGLCINCNGVIDNSGNPANPQNAASHFAVELAASCGSGVGRLNIGANGILKIGENVQITGALTVRSGSYIHLNGGIIEVRENSKLIIDSGAQLILNGGTVKVFDGGQIIVKDGGFLRYEDGVTIELNGNNAQLALGGLTHVGNDATFTFTWQGAESGYVRILEGYSGQRFSTGTNTKMLLKGINKNDKILHIERHANLWDYIASNGTVLGQNYTSVGFTNILFEKGTVQMDFDARIITIPKAQFLSVKFLSDGSRGIQSYRRTQFHYCDLVNTRVDARLLDFNQGTLSFNNSNLTRSRVDVRGKGFFIAYSQLEESEIWSYETSVMNQFIRSTSTGAGVGIYNHSLSDLYVFQSRFENAGTCLFKEFGGTVTARCSQFLNSDYGIEAMNRSIINLSSSYNGGYNTFENLGTNIFLHEANDLILERGFNVLNEGILVNIDGHINYPHPVGSPCPSLLASHNVWTAGNIPGSEPWHPALNQRPLRTSTTNCLINWHFGSQGQPTACPVGGGGPEEGPKSNNLSLMPKITTENYFDSIYFDEASIMAALSTTWMDTLGDNSIAAHMMYELLMAQIPAVNDSIDALVKNIRWNSLALYKSIIETMVADDVVLTANNSANFEPIVEQYAATLMNFTDSVKNEVNYANQFNLELYKVALFKTLNKKELALLILYNLDECEHDSINTIILANQIANVSFDIQMTQLGWDPFINDSVMFVPDSVIIDVGSFSIIDSSGFGTYIINANSLAFSACYLPSGSQSQMAGNMISQTPLYAVYPNPTREEMTIGVTNINWTDNVEIIFTVTDIVGKEMFRQKMNNSTEQINLPGLAPAPYIYYFTMNGLPAEQGRMIISK